MSSFSGRGGGGGGGRGGGRGGAYYKNKYGGGGRGDGGGGGGRGGSDSSSSSSYPAPTASGPAELLMQTLNSIHNQQYPKYHSIETLTGWTYSNKANPAGPPLFTLIIPKTQSDPFAKPTRVQLQIPPPTALFPAALFSTPDRSRALADYLLRALHSSCLALGADQAASGAGWSGPKGGDVQIMKPSQHVLNQTAVTTTPDGALTVNMTISLPARGRTILGDAAATIFAQTLPTLVRQSLLATSHNPSTLESYVLAVEDQSSLRRQLKDHNLLAFVADSSILPRASGADDRPLADPTVIPFLSPSSLQTRLYLPNQNAAITGMGIKPGVTTIVGGGFHGKSTLLDAIQMGIYDKVRGDGRDYIVTDVDAVKIRAEDGRQLHATDISPFISNLPFGKSTTKFTSKDASGSTSQAGAVMEALEMGATTLIFDEDTCATNFMIRDAKMSALVHAAEEPITPYIARIRALYTDHGISSLLVVGGAGDYLNASDTVIKMKDYSVFDVTSDAAAIVAQFSTTLPLVAADTVDWKTVSLPRRQVNASVLHPDWKCSVRERFKISYGDDVTLRLDGCEQLACEEQTNSVLLSLHAAAKRGGGNLRMVAEGIAKDVQERGVAVGLGGGLNGKLAEVRKYEIAAALNRLRLEGLLN